MINRAKPLLVATLVTAMPLIAPSGAKGAVIHAATALLTDVQAAVNSATDGDTVVVPPGVAHWTGMLNLDVGITLQGATIVAGAGTASPTVTDGTVILDDVASGNNNAPDLIRITANQNQVFRITGFTLRKGSRTVGSAAGGAIHVTGVVHGSAGGSLRIDHCLFDQLYRIGVFINAWATNMVVDHCVGNYANGMHSATVNNGLGWNGGDAFGDSSWADASYLGSEKFVFFEDNTVNNTAPVQTTGTIDSQNGGRYVVRHCYFVNCAPNTHGTETGGRVRGVRLHEWYQNTIKFTYAGTLGMVRSGTGVSWENTLLGSLPKGNFLSAARQGCWPMAIWADTAPNSGANGANSWDLNVTEPDGVTNVQGHAPFTFASGKAASNSADDGTKNGTVSVSGSPGWRSNQWVGYSITDTSLGPPEVVGTNYSSYIIANTGDTITYSRGTTATPPTADLMHFRAGDSFVIHKLVASLDQPGYGKCNDLIAYDSKRNPYNTASGVGVRAWPHQNREPLYSWSNTLNGSPTRGPTGYYSGPYPTVQPNREFYNEISPFDGTSGVGIGTLANRPSKCTKGVGYWATDTKTLYVASATNTWSVYYVPYVYPHPLVSGVKGPPAAPSNLRIVP
jgi:hypothetical protein